MHFMSTNQCKLCQPSVGVISNYLGHPHSTLLVWLQVLVNKKTTFFYFNLNNCVIN